DLSVERQVVVEVVPAAQADGEDVGDVVVDGENRPGVADELVVQRERPCRLNLETLATQRIDLLHCVHLLAEDAIGRIVEVDRGASRWVDGADVAQSSQIAVFFAAGYVVSERLVGVQIDDLFVINRGRLVLLCERVTRREKQPRRYAKPDPSSVHRYPFRNIRQRGCVTKCSE